MRTLATLLGLSLLATSAAGAQTGEQGTAPRPAVLPQNIVPYEAANPNEPGGDRLGPARRLAPTIVGVDNPDPHLVVDVGSFTGEFLEAFMEAFPHAHGQWTEPVDTNRHLAVKRLGRFGDRVSYRIGCPGRDLAQGCVPAGVDVMLTSWLSIHQNLAGIRDFYARAAKLLPTGGWVVNLDHVGDDPAWTARFKSARLRAVGEGLAATTEGPPVHHADFVTPMIEQQMDALRAAGFTDARVVWRRLDTVLLMARKP